jgi:hypothetical protein
MLEHDFDQPNLSMFAVLVEIEQTLSSYCKEDPNLHNILRSHLANQMRLKSMNYFDHSFLTGYDLQMAFRNFNRLLRVIKVVNEYLLKVGQFMSLQFVAKKYETPTLFLLN